MNHPGYQQMVSAKTPEYHSFVDLRRVTEPALLTRSSPGHADRIGFTGCDRSPRAERCRRTVARTARTGGHAPDERNEQCCVTAVNLERPTAGEQRRRPIYRRVRDYRSDLSLGRTC